MIVMTGPCEYCGNPDKSRWQSDCKYKGPYPSRRAFVLSTFDAPCSMDAYDEGQRELKAEELKSNVVIALTIVSTFALFFLVFFLWALS